MSAWFLLAALVACTFGPWAILDGPKAVRAIRNHRRDPWPADLRDEGMGEVGSDTPIYDALALEIFRAEMNGPGWDRLVEQWATAARDEDRRRRGESA